ncbi:ABC transporter permease [Nakamurella flava]|uniref:ABC transporter permease n=1 Tax=Nakamurella flava TaxID=2576308 RepID=A0A4U6QNG1_9ACTN|nr:ABC transporter permease [Nakamurella flava]TKV61602.1 ABC transporter permease [Nakamurella flava]
MTTTVHRESATAARGPVAMTLRFSALSAWGAVRNPAFLVFTAILPVAMYLLFNSLYGTQDAGDGSTLTAGAYLMVSMACYGAIGGSLNSGARVALERQAGWNRQLRLSALPGPGYLVGKCAVALLVAIPPIVLVFLLGATIGHVQLSATTWLLTGLALWLCTIPFAVIGLAIGSMVKPDTVQPVTMIFYLGLSILGGLWVPVTQFSATFQQLAEYTPAYWVADIGRTVLAGGGVPLQGIGVLAAWTVGLGAIGVAAYRRSGKRS